MIDAITFYVWICTLVPFAIWETYTLAKGEHPISVVARARGWTFTAFVYFWASMPIHWHVPSPFHATRTTTTIFWAIQGVILIWNVIMWRRTSRPLNEWPKWLLWIQWPAWYVAGGAISAWTLFPQNQIVPWGLP